MLVGVWGAGFAWFVEADSGEPEDMEALAGRRPLDLGLVSFVFVFDGGDLDRDMFRDPIAGRSGDKAFFARRGELVGVVSLPEGPENVFHDSCSVSISSAGRFAGDSGAEGSWPGVRLGLAEMLGGIEPKTDSAGGADGVGECAPDAAAFMDSSNDEPAGPGVG